MHESTVLKDTTCRNLQKREEKIAVCFCHNFYAVVTISQLVCGCRKFVFFSCRGILFRHVRTTIYGRRKMKFHKKDIAEALEQEIIANKMVPGLRLPSAAELAKRYSVSPKTADRALSRLARRKLIVRKRGSGNFVLDNHDPDERISVGFLWWSLNEVCSEEFFNPSEIFFEKIKSLMTERFFNYKVFVEDCTKLAQPINREKKYDIFVIPAGVILNNKEAFRSPDCVPMVIYGDNKYNSGPWHQVIYDFRPGFAAALEYCREMKISKFFVPFKESGIVRAKCDILLECAEKLGFKPSDFRFCPIPEDIACTIYGGEYCAEYFLEHHLQDHLIFSVSDYFTYGMQKVFKRENLKYSVDYSLISYDNFYQYQNGKGDFFKVSSITHPLEEHAQAVVDMIEDLVRGPETDFFRAYTTCAKEFTVR